MVAPPWTTFITRFSRFAMVFLFKTSFFLYSLEDFKLVKKFGKRGEGPGEIMGFNRVHLHVQPDKIMLSNPHKIMYFPKQGDFLKEFRSNPSFWGAVIPAAGNFVSLTRPRNTTIYFHNISIYDADLNKTIDIHQGDYMPIKKDIWTISKHPGYLVKLTIK
jgi:hypothetical protein